MPHKVLTGRTECKICILTRGDGVDGIVGPQVDVDADMFHVHDGEDPQIDCERFPDLEVMIPVDVVDGGLEHLQQLLCLFWRQVLGSSADQLAHVFLKGLYGERYAVTAAVGYETIGAGSNEAQIPNTVDKPRPPSSKAKASVVFPDIFMCEERL